MKTAVIILLVLSIAALILCFWSRSKRQGMNSFWDFVRNPDAIPDLNQFHSEVDNAASSLSGAPSKIAQVVDEFVFGVKSSDDGWTELRILAKLGDEAYPRSLEILRDPSLKGRLTQMTKHESILPESPINRLCKIFDQDAAPPEDAAVLLATYLESESDEIRKSVALIIGSIASTDSLSDLRRALTDKNEYVRSYALMGIQRAITASRIEDSSQDEFFSLVANMWPGDTDFNVCKHIPNILLKLDRERAKKYLLRDELFSVTFPPVWQILKAFNKESVEVPRTRLLDIIEEANAEQINYPMGNVLEQALPLLGVHRKEEDLPRLPHLLDHENESVSRGATEALYRFHRYYDQIRDPREVVEERGWSDLTTAEKHLYAIEVLDVEVNNGGFVQYYFNSSGDHWQDALEGLAAIGAEERHRLMLSTVEKFGETRPAVDRDTRTSQLAKIVRKKEDPFNAQDNAWYKIADENLDRLKFGYNLANLEGRNKVEPGDERQPE